MVKKYFRLMRVKHYIKNLLIFFPIVFSKNVFNQEKTIQCLFGFFAFCFISSAIYILNDIIDIEKDIRHPVKRNRPVASGEISIKRAGCYAVICIAVTLFIQLEINNISSAGCVFTYFFLNILYSCWLKEKPFCDIIILVSGFFLRILYGSMLTHIVISEWLYLTVISISFYMALGKRRNELKQFEGVCETRRVLKFYNYKFLDKNMYVCAGMANIFYSLWAADNGKKMLVTVPIVLLLSMRYSYNIENEGEQGDPVDILLNDKMILGIATIYAIYVLAVLYIVE